jgi:hypothetical protein
VEVGQADVQDQAPPRQQRECLARAVSAFVTDLLLRAFKHSSGFTSSLYEFVSNCQEFSLVPLKELINGALRQALETMISSPKI